MAKGKKKRAAKRKPAKKKATKKKTAAGDPDRRADGKYVKGKKGGPGRKKGVPNKVTKEMKEMAKGMLTNPTYLRSLVRRLHGGRLASGMESMLFYYAFGKPIDRLEIPGASFAQIVLQVANRPDPEPEPENEE